MERFSKRHELLNGPHRRAWYDWRAKKMKEALDELRSVVAKGGRKWEILLMSAAFGPEEETSGYRTSDFGDGTGNLVRLLARMTFGRECDLESYGTMFNAASLENVWRQGMRQHSPIRFSTGGTPIRRYGGLATCTGCSRRHPRLLSRRRISTHFRHVT